MKYYANKSNRQYILTNQEDVDLYKSRGFEIVPIIESIPVDEPIKNEPEKDKLTEQKLEVSLQKPKRGRPPKQK